MARPCRANRPLDTGRFAAAPHQLDVDVRRRVSAFPTKLIAEGLHHPNSERVFVTLYGLTLLAIRLLLAALDMYAQHEHLYAQDQADDEVQTERRELWPVIAAYVAAILIGLAAPTAAVLLYLGLGVFLVVPLRDIRRVLHERP